MYMFLYARLSHVKIEIAFWIPTTWRAEPCMQGKFPVKPVPYPHSVTTDIPSRKALRKRGPHPWSSCHHCYQCQNQSIDTRRVPSNGKRDRRESIESEAETSNPLYGG